MSQYHFDYSDDWVYLALFHECPCGLLGLLAYSGHASSGWKQTYCRNRYDPSIAEITLDKIIYLILFHWQRLWDLWSCPEGTFQPLPLHWHSCLCLSSLCFHSFWQSLFSAIMQITVDTSHAEACYEFKLVISHRLLALLTFSSHVCSSLFLSHWPSSHCSPPSQGHRHSCLNSPWLSYSFDLAICQYSAFS